MILYDLKIVAKNSKNEGKLQNVKRNFSLVLTLCKWE